MRDLPSTIVDLAENGSPIPGTSLARFWDRKLFADTTSGSPMLPLVRPAPRVGWEHPPAKGELRSVVRGNRHPDYHSASAYNPVDLFAPVPVYAWDRGPAVRAKFLEAYPDRPVWILDGPTITHDGFRVIAGPLTADQVRALP